MKIYSLTATERAFVGWRPNAVKLTNTFGDNAGPASIRRNYHLLRKQGTPQWVARTVIWSMIMTMSYTNCEFLPGNA